MRLIPAAILSILSLLLLTVGCRTAGPQVQLRDCRDCEVRIEGDIDAAQGKSVPVEVSPGRAVSAAVQASDNAVSSGEATVNDSAAGTKSADAAAVQADTATPTEDTNGK